MPSWKQSAATGGHCELSVERGPSWGSHVGQNFRDQRAQRLTAKALVTTSTAVSWHRSRRGRYRSTRNPLSRHQKPVVSMSRDHQPRTLPLLLGPCRRAAPPYMRIVRGYFLTEKNVVELLADKLSHID
jgi:hypothetical protein